MSKPASTRWTRDQLLVVLNLYHKLRFGQLHERQPVIIDSATRLGRTPGAVAMKLCNLASLDPVLKLRNIHGLEGASKLDGEIWEEYHQDAATLIPESQQLFDALFVEAEDETTEVLPGIGIHRAKHPHLGATEVSGVSKQRRGQDYFREIVLNNYGNSCAVTGLAIRSLLVASHILPWAKHETERLNVRNGISLNRLHDAAFDQGHISFDDDLRLLLSHRLRAHLPQPAISVHFETYEKTPLNLVDDAFSPNPGFLAHHRAMFGF